jgi:hypothetical protein
MTLRQQVTEELQRMPGGGVLVDINEGRAVPPLTDYLRPVPEDWIAPLPSLVDGLTLLPAFTNDDWFAIYCIEPATGRFFAIDPEAPWPPARVFASCRDFLVHFLRVVEENQTDEAAIRLRELLRGTVPSERGS